MQVRIGEFMDKYQSYLFNQLRISTELAPQKLAPNSSRYATNYIYDTSKGAKDFLFSGNGGKITITQNDNYHLHEYELTISHPKLKEVWCNENNDKVMGKNQGDHTSIISLDFDNKATSIFVSFEDDLADPIEIPVVYVDADKKAWDEKMEKEYRESLAKVVSIKITSGDSLVNVLFRPIDNEKYSYCIVTLFYSYTNTGEKKKTYQLIGDFKSDIGKFYIPICNLGYGSYAIDLKQYDKDDKLIYESGRIDFSLSRPKTPVYNGPEVVTIG